MAIKKKIRQQIVCVNTEETRLMVNELLTRGAKVLFATRMHEGSVAYVISMPNAKR